MQRGDIWFAATPGGDRPVLVLTRDPVADRIGSVVVAALTRTRRGLVSDLGVRLTERGNVWRDDNWMTSEESIFTAGDMQRGQSLIVWAIAEGRGAARGVDAFLMGASTLPASRKVSSRLPGLHPTSPRR